MHFGKKRIQPEMQAIVKNLFYDDFFKRNVLFSHDHGRGEHNICSNERSRATNKDECSRTKILW